MDASASFVGYETPRKRPNESEHADRLAFSQLSQTPDGRAASFESRLALQREIDGTRSALKTQERFSDDLRRQSVAAREEAAVYKAENLRLQDELRSAKARLNAVMDAQEELLRKNSDKHTQLLELQNREAKLRDELASRASLVEYYTEHNQQVEHQLREVLERSTSKESTLQQQLEALHSQTNDDRHELAARNAENESLRATIEALQTELRAKDELLGMRESEREEVQRGLRDSVARVNTLDSTQNALRSQIASKEDELRDLRNTVAELSATVNARERDREREREDRDRLSRSLVDRAELERSRHLADRLDLERSLLAHDRLLEARLAAARARERLLETEVRNASSASAARALSRYYQLKSEREEADRLDALARYHRRKALGLDGN